LSTDKPKLVNKGFAIEKFEVVKTSWRYGWKPSGNKGDKSTLKFRFAALRGNLEVTDPTAFRNTLECGIGSGKAFGFGLLTIAKIK
jgi:CRISPR system Cascade subunit CasE